MAVWSEIAYSQLTTDVRFDPEYYKPEYLALSRTLDKLGSDRLGNLSFVTDGIHASPKIADEGGIRYLSAKCVKDNEFAVGEVLSITLDQNKANPRTQLRENDVLLTTVGTIGNAAVVRPDLLPANADRHLGIIRLDPSSKMDPYYLSAFLNSKCGRSQTLREATGNVQLNLFIEKIKALRIPRLLNEDEIADMVRRSYAMLDKASLLYQEAEGLLVTSLGLGNLDLSPSLFYERPYRDVAAARRIDADYFQPKYDTLLSTMEAKQGQYHLVRLGTLSPPPKYGCSTKLEYVEEGRPFLRIADLDNKRFQLASVLHVPAATPFGVSDLVSENDVLISRSGTLGVAVPITREFAGSAYGSYFIRTRPDPKIIHPEFLALFINSIAGQMQVERKTTGGIQTNLTIPAIESLMIPLGDLAWQKQFVALVESSLEALRESKRLLDDAKEMVEKAV